MDIAPGFINPTGSILCTWSSLRRGGEENGSVRGGSEPTEDSSDEIALLGSDDTLLKPIKISIFKSPRVGNFHFAGVLAVPGIRAEGHHGVAVGPN